VVGSARDLYYHHSAFSGALMRCITMVDGGHLRLKCGGH
jgi:hypothetical protein